MAMPHRSPAPVTPAPRRPTATCGPAPVIPAQRQPSDAADAGRHRRTGHPLSATLDLLGRLGGAVSLSALLVVGAAIGGLTDGQPPADSAALSITFDTAP